MQWPVALPNDATFLFVLSSFFVFVAVAFTAFGTNTIVITGEESQCFGLRASQSNKNMTGWTTVDQKSQNKSYANPGKGNGQNETEAGKTT